jgi:dTDP-4-dehydrorhamnose reductase
MRTVVVGAAGQLGRELRRSLPAEGTVALTHGDLDVTDASAVAARLAALAPTVVVNAAADNRVDAAEGDPGPAIAVNALAVGTLAAACRATGAWLVHVSTDYVFDGRATRPYTEDDAPNPLGAYARSKLAGELLARTLAPRHAVVRVAGLYAAGGSRGKGGSFVDRVLARARAGEPLRIVADQVTAPTWARDVATALTRLLPRLVGGGAPGGIYHLTNAGACSWHEFARAALELAGVRATVESITTAALGAPAPRPAYSVLANTRLAAAGEPSLRPWRDALAAYLTEAGPTAPGPSPVRS